MNHSWCRDIPRDEAVRASEDGRSGPLPTLEECIAAASPLPGRVEGTHWADWERLRAERDAAIRERDRLAGKIVVMEGSAKMDMETQIAVEEAWQRCGIPIHWPSDEPETAMRCAESMEREIVRLRARVAELEAEKAVSGNTIAIEMLAARERKEESK